VKKPRIVSLEMESFRGIGETLTVDLDADAVIIRGDNGLGKSSLVDAILWLFCGELAHLGERVKGLRRTEDPIVNRYVGGSARVRITIRVDGRDWEFERTGTANRNELQGWLAGESLDEADHQLAHLFDDTTSDGLANAVRTWGVLRQDAVRAALDSGAALHDRLSGVLGLERVTLFSESAARIAKDIGQERQRLSTSRDQLNERKIIAGRDLADARHAATSQGDVKVRLAEAVIGINRSLPEDISVIAPEQPGLAFLAAFGSQVTRIIEATEEVARRSRARNGEARKVVKVADTITSGLIEAQSEAKEAVQRAPILAQLASAALETLGDECPVCERPIDQVAVRLHLQELLRGAEESMARAEEAQRVVARLQVELAEARAAEARRIEAERQLGLARSDLRSRLSETPAIHIEMNLTGLDEMVRLTEQLGTLRERLRLLYSEFKGSMGDRVVRAESVLEQLAMQVENVHEDLEKMNLRYNQARQLDRASHSAAERIVQRALRDLEPSFSEVFDRLAPHPTFTQLRAKQDVYYGHNQVVPEVYDPERKIAANPMLVYSEGQLNTVALSYFLGLALNAREGSLPFMVLDDPLQAMDVLSVLGFADLCRRVQEQRQLIITTHDRRFGDLLVRKLTPRIPSRRTVVITFEGWTREGPRVRVENQPVADVRMLLQSPA
jgi:DNA repair exonuclease SbcCD ATPase subunit